MSVGTQQAPMPWTPAPPQLVLAYSVCKGITRGAAKNFYYAFLVLPRRKREALYAVYAFMRRCDGITDDPTNNHAQRRQTRYLARRNPFSPARPPLPTTPILLWRSPMRSAVSESPLACSTNSPMAPRWISTSISKSPSSRVGLDDPIPDLRRLGTLLLSRSICHVGLVCIHIFGYRDPAASRRTHVAAASASSSPTSFAT